MEVELETFSICGTWYCLLFYFSITGVPPWWQYNAMWLQEHYHYNHNLHKASSRQCDLQESPVGAVDDENAAMVGNFAGAGVGTGGELGKIMKNKVTEQICKFRQRLKK